MNKFCVVLHVSSSLVHTYVVSVSDQRQKTDHEEITVPLLEVMQEIVEKELLLPATSLVSVKFMFNIIQLVVRLVYIAIAENYKLFAHSN